MIREAAIAWRVEVVCNLDSIGLEWSGVAKNCIAWSIRRSSYSLEGGGCM